MSFLYFIQCGCEHGPIKIGSAGDPAARRSTLQVGNPYPLSLISVVWLGAAAAELEAMAQFALRVHHIRGEWFSAAIRPFALELLRLVDAEWVQAIRQIEWVIPPDEDPEWARQLIEKCESDSGWLGDGLVDGPRLSWMRERFAGNANPRAAQMIRELARRSR